MFPLYIKYSGGRFQGGRIPAEILSDFVVAQRLIVSITREIWLRQNFTRKRTPKNFRDQVSFDLISIKSGSAIPIFGFSIATPQASLLDTILVEQAAQQICEFFSNFNKDPNSAFMTDDNANILSRFGASLRLDEKIDFYLDPPPPELCDTRKAAATFDRASRNELLSLLSARSQKREIIIGRLEGNMLDGVVYVYSEAHGKLRIQLDSQYIIQKLDGNLRELLQLDAEISLDRTGELRSIGKIYYRHIIDEYMRGRLSENLERIDNLRSLTDGWDHSETKKPSSKALDLCQIIPRNRLPLNNFCRIYPGDEGSIFIEFERQGFEFILEIFDNEEIQIYGLALRGGNELVCDFSGLTPEFWDYITSLLQEDEGGLADEGGEI